MTTLEEAKAFLKKDAGDGTSLYDHLSEVLLKILVERPDKLSDSFEHLSTAVKQQRYQPHDASGDDSALVKDSVRSATFPSALCAEANCLDLWSF